jgi:FixJ family two-component response regulator
VSNAPPLIAVVDDEAPVRTMLRRALHLADYEVAAFASGEEFLDSLATRPPACAILDVHMPGLSGLDVALRVRAASFPVPMVLITASDDAAIDHSAAAAGAVRLLRKPFSTDTLLAAVRDALAGKVPRAEPKASCQGNRSSLDKEADQVAAPVCSSVRDERS